ncbi:hypothetical protein R1sor_019812 [Riccia sorocarpa]|uniref:TMEM205-like domain-containing protein n=1 Tax=Riccia sorocarpa TaxID=122646 RepID=A0ABD3IDK0_9MARC
MVFNRGVKMMNIVAMWMLLTSLGTAMVLSPEPVLKSNGVESPDPLRAAKEASKQSVEYAADAARKTGEGIKQTVSAGVHSTGEFANSALDTMKETSQAGLEKIGLATPEKSTFEQWESGLQAAKEKATAASKGAADSARDASNSDHAKLTAREKFENLRKYGQINPPSTADVLKNTAAETYDAAKDTAGRAAGAVKDTVSGAGESTQNAADTVKETLAGAGEKIQNGVQTSAQKTYEAAENAAAATKEKISSAAGSLKKGSQDTVRYGSDKTYDTADFVSDLAARIAQSVQENVNAAGSKAYDTAGSAKDATVDTMGTAYEYAADALKKASGQTADSFRSGDESDQSYTEALRLATIQAAEMLRRRGSQAYDTAGSAKDATYDTVGSAYENAMDALRSTTGQKGVSDESLVKKLGGLRSGDESDESYTEKLKRASEQAAEVLKKKGEDAAKYMPNVGQGLSMGEEASDKVKRTASEQAEAGKTTVEDYAQKAKETIFGGTGEGTSDHLKRTASEQLEAGKKTAADYGQKAKETIAGGVEQSAGWREAFLDQVGIREEADLRKYDVVIGNVKGYWKAGDTVSGAREAARSMKDKIAGGMQHIGERIRHPMGKAQEAAEQTGDSLSRMGGKLNDTMLPDAKDPGHQNVIISSVKWLGSAVAAWLVSSVKAAHLLSFSSTFGASLWVTFISGYLLSKSLGRQQYGFVQSKMFPTYLRLIAGGQALCLVLYMMLKPWTRASSAEKLQHFNLWGILLSTLANLFFVEPRATKTMFEKLKLEKEEGSRAEEEAAKKASDFRGSGSSVEETPVTKRSEEVKEKFSLLHGVSSLLNLLALMGETWHLWHLSNSLAV